MSSIHGLLSEVRPNLEIIQVIKAADQLYYKDKTHYTEIKPEFTSSTTSVGGKLGSGVPPQQQTPTPVATHQVQEKPKQQQPPPQEASRTKNASESKPAEDAQAQPPPPQTQKQSKKDKKKAKAAQAKAAKANAEAELTKAEPTDGDTSSKLQQVIEQAKKTVSDALNIGSKEEPSTECNSTTGAMDELKRAKAENCALRQKLAEQEKRLNKLERATKKLLASSGLTEADLSD